jgi:eukaryotic-like serine/threonine-protein kinase
VLNPGAKLGPYEIASPIGAGGMGEVYRARDTRLDRTVAIKILPAQLSSDPVRKQRFEREAKTISSLNHPHICVLHDVGSQNGIEYLVMECVEGETLSKRLDRGPLPLEQVEKYGAQIADALDKAHRSSVIHRDLKPGNIMLTATGAKLLDFGLAKTAVALSTELTATAATSPVTPATQEGMIVGTFQYMSPEQVEGREADGRSDIFSLGAVLYEMATGKRAFEGKSQLSVASAILEKDPVPVATLKPGTPPALDYTIRKCLAKSPEDRWQSAADIKHQLDWIAQSSSDTSAAFAVARQKTSRKPWLWIAVGTVAALALGAIGGYLSSPRAASQPVVRATITPFSDVTLLTLGDDAGAPALSPDGKNLLFVGSAGSKKMLFLRSMDSGDVKSLAGTEGGKFPFWSSDGKSIAFFANEHLKRVSLTGGLPIDVAPALDGRGGTWSGETIVFAPYIYDGLYRVPAAGGTPVPVTVLDRSVHTTHRWPCFLPDGKHFLYLAANHQEDKEANSGIYAGSIDGAAPKLILRAASSTLYASGELLYFRDGSLIAQPFNPDRLELAGEAAPIAPVLFETDNWGMIASASQNGILVYQSAGQPKYPSRWYDRSGRPLGPGPIEGQLQDLRLSPDGSHVAAALQERIGGYVYAANLKTGAGTRLTFGGAGRGAWSAALSPDGSKVVYSFWREPSDSTELWITRTNGSGAAERLLASGHIDHPTDWTRNGNYIVFDRGPGGAQQIWILPLFGDRKPFRLLPNLTAHHAAGIVSPNGKWIAYIGSETGAPVAYITSFPDGNGRWQVSTDNPNPPLAWRGDGKELYFVGSDGNFMAASIAESGGSIVVRDAKPLFRSPFVASVQRILFDVDPSGQRFLGAAAPDTSSLPLDVITSWPAMLKSQ